MGVVLVVFRAMSFDDFSLFRLFSPSAGTLLIDPETLLLALSTGSAVLDTGQKHAVSYIYLAMHLIGFSSPGFSSAGVRRRSRPREKTVWINQSCLAKHHQENKANEP